MCQKYNVKGEAVLEELVGKMLKTVPVRKCQKSTLIFKVTLKKEEVAAYRKV